VIFIITFNEVSVLTVKIILCYTKRGANRGAVEDENVRESGGKRQ